MISNHMSSSHVQQKAELMILKEVANKINIPLEELQPTKLQLKETTVNLDGYSKSEQIVCEVYARVGKLKPSQKNKVTNDVMKMLLLDKVMGMTHRKIICICDRQVEDNLTGKGWNALALKEFGIEIIRVELEDSMILEILDAQKRQYR